MSFQIFFISVFSHPASTNNNEKIVAVNSKSSSHKSSRSGNSKPEKSKPDQNNGKKDIANSENVQPKAKKFDENYVEAPLPAVNPWKKTSNAVAPSAVGFRSQDDPSPNAVAPSVVRVKEITKHAHVPASEYCNIF